MLSKNRRCSTIRISLHHLLLDLLHFTLRGARLKNGILVGKSLLERAGRCSLGCCASLALVSGLKRRATNIIFVPKAQILLPYSRAVARAILAHVVIGVTCRSVLRIGLLHGLSVLIFGLGIVVLSELS